MIVPPAAWLALAAVNQTATFLHDAAPFAGALNTLLLIALAAITTRGNRKLDQTKRSVEAAHADVGQAALAAAAAAASAADAARIARDIGGTLRHTDSPVSPIPEANP
jgi:hypothetical protein